MFQVLLDTGITHCVRCLVLLYRCVHQALDILTGLLFGRLVLRLNTLAVFCFFLFSTTVEFPTVAKNVSVFGLSDDDDLPKCLKFNSSGELTDVTMTLSSSLTMVCVFL